MGTLPHGTQAIHAFIKVISHPKFKKFTWLLSGVYASPRQESRNLLWEEFKLISEHYTGPWSLIGDFNDIINHNEKSGGRPPTMSRIFAYQDTMNYCNMLDLGFTGPLFTWNNERHGTGLIKERLDRVWGNANWKALFPDSSLFHLLRTHSDHCPLLLHLE